MFGPHRSDRLTSPSPRSSPRPSPRSRRLGTASDASSRALVCGSGRPSGAHLLDLPLESLQRLLNADDGACICHAALRSSIRLFTSSKRSTMPCRLFGTCSQTRPRGLVALLHRLQSVLDFTVLLHHAVKVAIEISLLALKSLERHFDGIADHGEFFRESGRMLSTIAPCFFVCAMCARHSLPPWLVFTLR